MNRRVLLQSRDASVFSGTRQGENSLAGRSRISSSLTSKRDVGDIRESPALDMMEMLQAKGAEVRYHDSPVGLRSGSG